MADPRWDGAKDDRYDREEALVRDDRPALAYAQNYYLEGERFPHESSDFARNICRLQMKDGYHIGTGWLLRNSTYIITCKHVIDDFKGHDMYVCFRPVPANPIDDEERRRYIRQVTEEGHHAEKDVALLRFADEIQGKQMIASLGIGGLELDPKYQVDRGEGIRVIGYPGPPTAQQDARLLAANFGRNAKYSILRYSKGTVMGVTSKDSHGNIMYHCFEHDCSALVGSSGSPVLNDSYQVVGMHRGGTERSFNRAVYPSGIRQLFD